jgi:hypothetical protein
MNSNTDYDTDNDLGQSIDDLYGYEEHILSPALFTTTDAVLTVPCCTSPTAQDYPPMPKERLARKQRSFGRRGGADHSALLKSAVLASLEFNDYDSDEDAVGRPRRSSVASFATTSDDGMHGPPSPRKRARFGDEDREENEELAIERASELFETMCVGLSESETPVREVLRHTSGLSSSFSESETPVRRVSRHISGLSSSFAEIETPVRRVSRRTSYDGDDASPSATCGLGDEC